MHKQVTPLPPEPPPDTGPPPMPAAPSLPSPLRAPAHSSAPSNRVPGAQVGISMQPAADGVATQPVVPREGMVVLQAAGGSLEAFCRQELTTPYKCSEMLLRQYYDDSMVQVPTKPVACSSS